MKYHIKKTKDNFPLNEEHAIELAKKQLGKTGYFAAIYGKNVNGKKEFHTPILVSESTLRSAKNELLNEDPNSALYAVYREHLDDAPTYEVEYRGGEAYLDLPDEEVSNFIKGKMQEIIDNPRLYQKYKYELEDLFEEDLQRYVDEQFYQKGRGEVYKDSKISYSDLYNELFDIFDKKGLDIDPAENHNEGGKNVFLVFGKNDKDDRLEDIKECLKYIKKYNLWYQFEEVFGWEEFGEPIRAWKIYIRKNSDTTDDSFKGYSHDEVILTYEDLELELTGRQLYAASMEGPAEYEDFEVTEDYEYEVDPDDVEECLFNILKDKYKEKTDEDIEKIIDENWDTLVEQYEDDLKDHFEESAKEQATEYYQRKYDEGYYDDYE